MGELERCSNCGAPATHAFAWKGEGVVKGACDDCYDTLEKDANPRDWYPYGPILPEV